MDIAYNISVLLLSNLLFIGMCIQRDIAWSSLHFELCNKPYIETRLYIEVHRLLLIRITCEKIRAWIRQMSFGCFGGYLHVS